VDIIRRGIVTLLVGNFVATRQLRAQSFTKTPRIGFLWMGSEPDGLFESFRQALRGLGYEEGVSVAFVHRYGRTSRERLIAQAGELARLDLDVIVAAGAPSAVVARSATTQVPIVFLVVGDPVATGLVASLARPGGNLTGVAVATPEQAEKRLALLTQAAPEASRIAVLWNPDDRQTNRELDATKALATRQGLQIQPLEVRSAGEFAHAFEEATRERAAAMSIITTPFIVLNQRRLAELALKHRLPAIFWDGAFARLGGLMAFGPSERDIAMRTATAVSKVLKGARPGELPVEQPTRNELVINLNTARALRLNIPKALVAQADVVIG